MDGWMGRVVALAVIAAAAGTIAYHHRDDLFPSPQEAPAMDPELAACLERRVGPVERMRAQEVIDEAQYAQFRERAEALCESRFGAAPPGAGGPMPGMTGPGMGGPGGGGPDRGLDGFPGTQPGGAFDMR